MIRSCRRGFQPGLFVKFRKKKSCAWFPVTIHKFLVSEQLIGANIRAIRQASKASLDDVAKRAGITKSTLSKIENAKISTPISTLVAIAKALGVRLAAFFKEEEVSGYVLTRNGKGKAIVRDGTRFGYTYEALAIDFQNKPVEPFFLTI